MGRTFYTERDIEDLAKRGIGEIEFNDGVYITDLAREKMEMLAIKTKAVPPKSATSSPPLTPSAAPAVSPSAPVGSLSDDERHQVIDKVKSGVIARLGPGVDMALVDTIVRRVVSQL
jgi:hypothetical protein